MITQFAGIWLGIIAIAAWSIVCILLGLLFVQPFERIVIVGLWLLVVLPVAWAFWRTARGRF